MRPYKKMKIRGFTLVELMIVVAIIGVLAALAIYGVRRYLASAKTSEAKNSLGAITSGAVAAYERESAPSEMLAEGGVSTNTMHILCPTALAVPGTFANVQNKKYLADSTGTNDYQSAEWKCVRFEMSQPQYYQYVYTSVAATSLAAIANGDLDGDGTQSLFQRNGSITAKGTLILDTKIAITDEFE